MPVTAEVQQVLDLIAAAPLPPLSDASPEELRAGFAALATIEGEPVASVHDHVAHGPHGPFTVRVYRPAGAEASSAAALVWFHGGGFVLGDLATTDSTARAVANRAGVVVVSVDYHLAPEHPFPAAVDDAVVALEWVVDNAAALGVDPGRVAVGGDSAGGNLAAVTAQIARAARGPAIAFQLLVYPVIDLGGGFPSLIENGEGYFLTRELMEWFTRMYLGGRSVTNPRVSPLRSTDLSGLPPALVITAEFDPLRDEGEAYADALRSAGVDVTAARYDGMIHGFFGMDHLPECSQARQRAADALREALAR